ncbi:V-type ATP synthase subunit E family protein [Nonomuraea sp. NPDC048826]|uniref:V-type ATP synthase subunit E family protein n=1 Tax=Nonomuraea sp. NPDC048826 TaxID=3364347 RepID=UPI0037226057
MNDSIAALRAELLRTAGQEAEQVRSQAENEATGRVAAARREVGELLAAARADGLAQAAADDKAERIKVEREARRLILTARREALEELRSHAAAAASRLRDDQRLLRRLRDLVGDRLGAGHTLAAHPDGGIVGQAPGRRVDAGLPTLAARAIDEMGAEVERLWRE